MKRVFFLVLLLAGCASPDPSYFTLAPVPGAAVPGGPPLVELRRPGLAGYLDRSEIVRQDSPYQLKMASGDRWGEPFGDLVARVLAEDLSTRLPGSSVFTAAGSISALADTTIELDVQRFDADASGQVVLMAQVAVSRGRGREAGVTRTIRLTVTPSGSGTAQLVAAMSGALGQAADEIAAMVRRP